jgi:alpha-galactosidase
VKELSHGDWAVCFFNTGQTPLDLVVDWSHFTMMKGSYTIRDLWQHKDIGDTTHGYNFTIPSHDVMLLRLSKS